jgi:nitroimidazol reductase NimA-like FMN-containing flavoprotein (pyridoxamine 5'-phosphate oxidase superfamily)
MRAVRIHKAMPMAPGMDQSEVDSFLAESRTLMRLGTSDAKGDPVIHPVWYYYVNNKLYLMSDKDTLKVRNINRKKTVYFSVDTDAMPNRGVKGKGTATIVKGTGKSVSISEKIISKYLGASAGAMGKSMIDRVRDGSEVLVEITPTYFSTWDYTKMKF